VKRTRGTRMLRMGHGSLRLTRSVSQSVSQFPGLRANGFSSLTRRDRVRFYEG
jgi:hypothetical protein